MKVGICFYGQPRKYKQVLSQWNQIISELNADIFIHTWHGQDRGRADININELIRDFLPKEIQVSNQHRLVDLIPEDAKYENQSYHTINQSYSITESFQLLKNYSKNFNKEYDVIVRSRFDITLHDIVNFIQFIKNNIESDKLYVAANHWEYSPIFDDNIMIAKDTKLIDISTDYFNSTVEFINTNKIIPGGEHNIFRYINTIGMIDNITKVNSLNFNLIPLPFNEIILNQNEK
jgi:hypothetical protein